MIHAATRPTRRFRRGNCRRLCASEKRCTGIFGARTGYRFYNLDSGRWLNRDPIAERGGLNVYGFVWNDGINRVDKDGRTGWGFTGPWGHNYYDPKCPGPNAYVAGVVAMIATLLTPVPGDEAIVAGAILKNLNKLRKPLNKCCRCNCTIGLHNSTHGWPVPGRPNKIGFRKHFQITCYDRKTKKKWVTRVAYGPFYKEQGGFGGGVW